MPLRLAIFLTREETTSAIPSCPPSGYARHPREPLKPLLQACFCGIPNSGTHLNRSVCFLRLRRELCRNRSDHFVFQFGEITHCATSFRKVIWHSICKPPYLHFLLLLSALRNLVLSYFSCAELCLSSDSSELPDRANLLSFNHLQRNRQCLSATSQGKSVTIDSHPGSDNSIVMILVR